MQLCLIVNYYLVYANYALQMRFTDAETCYAVALMVNACLSIPFGRPTPLPLPSTVNKLKTNRRLIKCALCRIYEMNIFSPDGLPNASANSKRRERKAARAKELTCLIYTPLPKGYLSLSIGFVN